MAALRFSSTRLRNREHWTELTEPIFVVEHLSLAYPGHGGHAAATILTGISFKLERGRALTLVGRRDQESRRCSAA
jgi:hypothetical protein